MTKLRTVFIAFLATIVVLPPTIARAFDHPGHMTTAAIAFAEIERQRPDLINVIGTLFLAHPDPAPFWVAVGEAKAAVAARKGKPIGHPQRGCSGERCSGIA